MNSSIENLNIKIDEEMNSSQIIHKKLRLEYLIDVKEEIPEPQIALSVLNLKSGGDVIIGSLGDFGLVIGKAKSRKSFFISIAIATALGKDLILNRFQNHLPLEKSDVLYFDTEQSKYYVQKAVKRVCTQVNVPEPKNLHAFYLRSLSPKERLQFIENEIYSNDKVGFVVIDGIKDLITSINDENEASMMTSKLLKWTEERQIFILTVLHQNKNDENARGHIGTELINKAQTVLSITKDEKDKNISIVEANYCRNKEPEAFAFEINEFGIPIEVENFEIRTATNKSKFDFAELENYKLFELLNDVFSNKDSFGSKELEIQIKFSSKKVLGKQLSAIQISEYIVYCKNNKWLIQEKPKGNYTKGEFKTEVS
jgi:hypothetical protein